MTFFILTEVRSDGEALAAQLISLAPESLCFVMTDSQELACALLEVQVDRVVVSPAAAEQFSWSGDAKPPHVFLWPESADVLALADRLLE